MTSLQKRVNNAKTLTELRNLLNGFVPETEGERLDEVVELCALPSFGGVTPSDTIEVWSWDAENVLLYDNGQYYIEARNPDAWYDRNNVK